MINALCILQVGEKIDVLIRDPLNKKRKRCYSMIYDLVSGDEAIITLPMSGGKAILLRVGEIIKVSFFRPDGEFLFHAQIVERLRSETNLLFKIKPTSPTKRLQRRNFFRLKTTIPILYRVNDGQNFESSGSYKKGYTCDISGGGMKIAVNEFLESNSIIEIKLLLFGTSEIILEGRTLRTEKEITEKPKYFVAICFINISQDARDEIIKFIFNEQRKLRKKELE